MVDCEKCVHYEDNSYCEECEHYDRDFYDHYEEATPEIIAKREEEERLQAEEKAIDEWISVKISDEFREVFNLAKKCASDMHFRRAFMGVYVSPDGCLVASDTRQIVEIPCKYIPKELFGKCVIKLGENQAGIHTEQKFPAFEHYFTLDEKGNQYFKSFNYAMATINEIQFFPLLESIEVKLLKHKDTEIAFQKKYLDLMKIILTGDIVVYYNPENKLTPVLFVGNNAKMVVVPLRRHAD
jgi:hypothetical protein